MALTFGDPNPKLTKAIKRVARESANVIFSGHAEDRMDERGFDHDEVLTCLRRGTAYGPEGDTCNVVHLGLHIRVAVGGLQAGGQDWTALEKVTVATVIRTD